MEWPYEIYGYLHDTNLLHITIMIGSSMKQREKGSFRFQSNDNRQVDHFGSDETKKRFIPFCQRNDGSASTLQKRQ